MVIYLEHKQTVYVLFVGNSHDVSKEVDIIEKNVNNHILFYVNWWWCWKQNCPKTFLSVGITLLAIFIHLFQISSSTSIDYLRFVFIVTDFFSAAVSATLMTFMLHNMSMLAVEKRRKNERTTELNW